MYNFNFRYECFERYISTCNIRNIKISSNELMKIFFGINRRVIPFFDLNVNTLCSLKCKKCDQGIPYLNEKKIYTYLELRKFINAILEKVDYVYQMSIIGGEPLINNDLDKIIEYCAQNEKIGSVIVITNGTIMPSKEILNALNNDKVIIGISWYPLSDNKNREQLIDYFEKNDIRYHVRRSDWLDFGDWHINRNYDKKILEHTFKNCFLNNCIQYNNGVMYRCAKQFLLKDQKILEPGLYETIDVLSLNKKEFNKAIKKFYALKGLTACNYCNTTEEMVKIPIGEQL